MIKYYLSSEKIQYDNNEYKIKVNGKDEEGAGGLRDLSKAFIENLSNLFDEEGCELFGEDLDKTFDRIEEYTYHFLKDTLLKNLKFNK